LPRAPGVYLMKDDTGRVLYVGKATSLQSRVRSYFTPLAYDGRVQFRALVDRVDDVDYIVTDTDLEALILEATLVKRHKPRYNIRLKDDKKYPFIEITDEPFPRIRATRDVVKGRRTLGPYSDVKAMRKTLDTMRRLFRIRSCDYDLPCPGVRVCLDFEIKRCDGPCESLISQEDYGKIVEEAILFLKGRNGQVVNLLKDRMNQAATELRFEDAAAYRDRIDALERVTNRQRVVSQDETDLDAVGIAREDDEACVVVLEVREGRLVSKQHYFMGGVLNAPDAKVTESFVEQFYVTHSFIPREIWLPYGVEEEILLKWLQSQAEGPVSLRVPQRGEKAQLMRMADHNATLLLQERRLKRENRRAQPPASVTALQRDLNLPGPPRRIEAIDISNIQGTDPVASLVTFVNGRARKSDYRHFKIRDIEGADDFAMMHQVVTRRFRRLKESGAEFPDLLLVDGGKGQLSSAVQALHELGIENQLVIGLAKRLEEVFVPGLSDAQNIPKTSLSLRLLQMLRDESHRFANTFHRNRRKKRTLVSELDGVPGVGPSRRTALLKHFGSMKRLRQATAEEVAAVEGIGGRLAEIIVKEISREGAMTVEAATEDVMIEEDGADGRGDG